MLADGKSLSDVQAYLDPANGLPARHSNCVVREAWNIAVRQARIPRKPKQPVPQKTQKERERRIYRAERRNVIFGRAR
jgi:hypothetical protein